MYTYFWDIETSTIITDCNNRFQVTYLSNVVKMDYTNGNITSSKFFRTIEETVEHFNTLEDCTIWCHNLDYELTFLLRELGETHGVIRTDKEGRGERNIYGTLNQDIILRDKHAPITIRLDKLPHILFRDSYCVFNKSVATLGEEIGLPKLDYDYKKVRLPWDKLTKLDYEYNERDNIIVAKSIYKHMKDNDIKFENIPLTYTSFVKRKRVNFIKDNFGKKTINKFYFDRNCQCDDFRFFELSLHVFQGGLTASNINHTGKFIDKGMFSIDAKSMYPFQMCSKFFPFYGKDNTNHYINKFADIHFKAKHYKGFIGTFRFRNIRIKNRNYLLPISSSQLSKGYASCDKVLFNGKLMGANEIILPCNNIDIDTINLVYDYEEVECLEIYSTNKTRRLRIEEVSFLLKAFLTKEKVTNKESLDYILSKVYINAMYGVKVTCPVKSQFTIEDGEINSKEYFDLNEEEKKWVYDNYLETGTLFGGTLDIYTDGTYITSYSRYMLVDMMKKLVDIGANVVYSDTDSLKYFIDEKKEEEIINLINNENNKRIKDNMKNPRFKDFCKIFNCENDDLNIISNLGIWELENEGKKVKLFVTYGAKKYGYITFNDTVKTTIAGCNKKKPSIAINNLAKKENISIVEAFKVIMSTGTTFDITASGRTVSSQEKRSREEVQQYRYKGRKINQYGGIIIDDTTYTLGMTTNDSKLLGMATNTEEIIKVNIDGGIDYGSIS